MNFDLSSYLGTVTRAVADGEREGVHTKIVTATRRYDTDPDDLWQALTDPERLPRWFAPVTGDLRLGGRYQIKGNAGGTITACTPPKHLGLDWEFAGYISWVTVELAPEDGGTRLRLVHEAQLYAPFWDTYGPGATGVGWELSLLGLARYLAGPPHALDPAEGEAWAASDEGKAMIAGFARAWGEADEAHGETPAQAAKAAESTRRFYTGAPAPEG